MTTASPSGASSRRSQVKKVEAMEWAAEYAERNHIFTPPQNQRGYTVDGWKNPTPAERTSIIQQLAKSVIDEPTGETVRYHMSRRDICKHSLSTIEVCED